MTTQPITWLKDYRGSGDRYEYLITERAPYEFPLYFRAKGETAYLEYQVYRSVSLAQKVAAQINAAFPITKARGA